MHKLNGHRHKHVEIATGTTLTLKGEPCPPDQLWYFETVTVYDDTTDNSNCLVSIKSGATYYPIFYFKDITSTEYAKKFMRLWIFPGEQIVYEWTDIISGDRLEMIEHGHTKIYD